MGIVDIDFHQKNFAVLLQRFVQRLNRKFNVRVCFYERFSTSEVLYLYISREETQDTATFVDRVQSGHHSIFELLRPFCTIDKMNGRFYGKALHYNHFVGFPLGSIYEARPEKYFQLEEGQVEPMLENENILRNLIVKYSIPFYEVGHGNLVPRRFEDMNDPGRISFICESISKTLCEFKLFYQGLFAASAGQHKRVRHV